MDPEDEQYFRPGETLIVAGRSLTVRALRRGRKGPQVAFVEVGDLASAEEIRGCEVRAPEARELAGDEYWPHDLIGLEVRPGGGVVVGVEHGVGQDRLVVERSGETLRVPFVRALVPVVDLAAGYVEIVEIEGLSQP